MIITIDGPTASGKSSAAQLLALKLGLHYLNSGFLYRAFAYLLINNKGYTLEQLKKTNGNDLDIFLDESKFVYKQDSMNRPHVFFDNRDITEYLKRPLIDQAASIVSANKNVRDKLLFFQRKFAQENGLVTDGRDMGTVVFANANFKFFLTASLEVRAGRWMRDHKSSDNNITIDKAIVEISTRDERDAHREVAPLKVPEDAIFIDNSSMTLNETVELMMSYITQV